MPVPFSRRFTTLRVSGYRVVAFLHHQFPKADAVGGGRGPIAGRRVVAEGMASMEVAPAWGGRTHGWHPGWVWDRRVYGNRTCWVVGGT